MNNNMVVLDAELIKNKIYNIRGQKVMLDSDLAEIYGYSTKRFNEQVQRNIKKFDEDFMFQLTTVELENLRSQIATSRKNNFFSGQNGGRRYLPYVFTEQGIYMLMTVLKGELAIKQSKALIRIFKSMKDYITYNQNLTNQEELLKISLQTNENTNDIKKIKENMATKKELNSIIDNFIDKNKFKEFLILNGQTIEADLAYSKIYSLAKKTIFIIDNYISLKTLYLLRNIKSNVDVVIFSDNINNNLKKYELEEFKKEYKNININLRKTNNVFHDRYIIIDYRLKTERIYHAGASSKDTGKRITTITQLENVKLYYSIIDQILNNDKLILK